MATQPEGVTIPTEEELNQLPRWARVAFAARCARRVFPLFEIGWLDAPDDYIEKINRAITLAETAVQDGETWSEATAIFNSTYAAASHAKSIATRASSERHASRAVANAAYAAAYIAADPDAFADAALIAADASFAAYPYTATTQAIRADFEWLFFLAQRFNWDEDTPIDPDLLGPLWPQGAPEWWLEEPLNQTDKPPTLLLEFAVPAGIPKPLADEAISNVLTNADLLHRAMGGTGLTFADVNVHECEPSLVPVGGGDDENGGGL